MKTQGREAGRKCVIVEIIDQSFVLVTGPPAVSGVKRRRVNIRHLAPTNEVLKIARRASDEEVLAAAEAEGRIEMLKAKAPL